MFFVGVSLVIHVSLLSPFALLKLIPIVVLQDFCSKAVTFFAHNWVNFNSFLMRTIIRTPVELELSPRTKLRRTQNYMIIVNHQSATDILVLQYLFNTKIPFLRFFIKKELLYVPLLGLAWWALDYPFVKRYSREKIKKKPQLANADIQVVRRMVKIYQKQKVSILNFVEGSRRTTQKIKEEGKKRIYKHLLKPRSSGMSVVLSHMQHQLAGVLDITIVYPRLNITLGDFMSGKVEWIKVYADLVPIEEVPVEENVEIAHVSKGMHRWLNERWQMKDEILQTQKTKLGAKE